MKEWVKFAPLFRFAPLVSRRYIWHTYLLLTKGASYGWHLHVNRPWALQCFGFAEIAPLGTIAWSMHA